MEQIINQYYDVLLSMAPTRWEELLLHIGRAEGSREIRYYIKYAGKYYSAEEAAALTGASPAELLSAFRKLNAIAREDKGFDHGGFSLKIMGDGKFSAEYENEAYSPEQWRAKYMA